MRFSFEIIPEASATLDRQGSSVLILWLGSDEMAADGSTMASHAVGVTFPDGNACLDTLGSSGYGLEDSWVDEETGKLVERACARHICIHFPRSTLGMAPTSYAFAHQHALSAP